MLAPVTGNYDSSQANRRNLPIIDEEMIEQSDTRRYPPVYLFNVGPRRHELTAGSQGPRFIEPCPKGKAHSEPLLFKYWEIQIYDLADGAGNMGRLDERGMKKALALIHSGQKLSLDTANLEWFGVFATDNEKPTAAELKKANDRLNSMMRLIYDAGSGHKLRGTVFHSESRDPEIYNEACAHLGQPPLFGVADHTMGRCVFCLNTIIEGAIVCTHCNSRQDTPEAKELRKVKV